MELQHSFTVPADVDTAWATLVDVQGVAPCFPGATLTTWDGDEFTGQVKVKLGPVSLQYAGRGRFVERDDAEHRAVIEAHGSDRRGNGTAGATVEARLEPDGDDATRVVVATRLKVTGRPAQFGRGVMQDVGSRIVDQFAGNLARQLSAEPASEPAATAEPVAGPAAAAGPAAGPAAEPAAELVPEPAPAAGSTVEPAPGPETVREAAPEAGAGAVRETLSAPEPVAEPVAESVRVPAAPAPAPVPGPPAASGELDLNAVVGPVLARQFGPTLATVLATALVTWLIARRRYRRR